MESYEENNVNENPIHSCQLVEPTGDTNTYTESNNHTELNDHAEETNFELSNMVIMQDRLFDSMKNNSLKGKKK